MDSPRFCSWAPDRLLRDPAARRMNAEQFGGYCSLLIEAWLDQTGTIPTDEAELAMLARMTPSVWKKNRTIILSLFHEQDGRYQSPIIEEAMTKILQKSKLGKYAVGERERRKGDLGRYVEPANGSDDDRTMIGRSSKEKEKEKEKEKDILLLPERKTTKRISAKALETGNPKNNATWERFDETYPRPGNGRKLERADARLIWDLLLEAGTDAEAIISGAIRFANHTRATHNEKYVPMMTTWLNKRQWEESWRIDTTSSEGKAIMDEQARMEKEAQKARREAFRDEYDKVVRETVREGAESPEYVKAWRSQTITTMENRKKLAMHGAVRFLERVLSDPEKGKEDRARAWKEANPLPTFEEWCEAREGAE